MSVRNEWSRIGETTLRQTTELQGADVEIEFAQEDGSDVWGLRVWPHIPEGASEIPLPEMLEPMVGEDAHIGNWKGSEFWTAWHYVDGCTVESLYARFDGDKAADIVAKAKVI